MWRRMWRMVPLAMLAYIAMSQSLLAFDASPYRQNTYGPPTHYCDPTRSLSSSGAGTLADPWNMTQCQTQPVAGNVVGILAVGSGTPVAIASTNDDNIPAFNPSNSGTSTNPIVYTCQYAAVALDYATITTNPNRCEFRHDGTPATGGSPDNPGTGSAMLGANGRNYIIFDGFYINMSFAALKEDSGVIRCEDATGIQFRNFVIKGTATDVDANAVIYRSGSCVNTVLSNFVVKEYWNNSTGDGLNQPGLFSDQYGDQNFLIEHFEIEFPANATRIPHGIYLKGAPGGVANYGVIRYGIIRNSASCLRFNATHATQTTEVHHVVCDSGRENRAILWSAETQNVTNVLVHHLTVAKWASTDGEYGCFGNRGAGNGFGTNNVIRDSICDMNAGSPGYNFYSSSGMPSTLNYLGHYRSGSSMRWQRPGGSDQTSLAAWQADCSCEADSLVATASPFIDRAGGNYRLANGHAWLTASSTGGEIGAYEGEIDPGIDLATGAATATLSGGSKFTGTGRLQ